MFHTSNIAPSQYAIVDLFKIHYVKAIGMTHRESSMFELILHIFVCLSYYPDNVINK